MSAFSIGFSSIGMPKDSLESILESAVHNGCSFHELRVLGEGEDLRLFLQGGPTPLPVQVLGTSFLVARPADGDLAKFATLVELAALCKAPYIRVFGGGNYSPTPLPEETLRTAASTIAAFRAVIRDRNASCEVLLETHDIFSDPSDCARLNELLDEPVALLWDSHHTWRLAGISLEDAWHRISPWIAHVHYKDSVPCAEKKLGFRYVFPGEGQFPTASLFDLLREAGYTRTLSLEWERMWHPELPPQDEAWRRFLALLP